MYLVRKTDGFHIPYDTVNAVTLIALLRMNLLPDIKEWFYDLTLQIGAISSPQLAPHAPSHAAVPTTRTSESRPKWSVLTPSLPRSRVPAHGATRPVRRHGALEHRLPLGQAHLH